MLSGVQDRRAASRIFGEAASPEIHQEIAGRSQFQTLPHQANTHCDREHVGQLRSDFSMFQKNGCYYIPLTVNDPIIALPLGRNT